MHILSVNLLCAGGKIAWYTFYAFLIQRGILWLKVLFASGMSLVVANIGAWAASESDLCWRNKTVALMTGLFGLGEFF